MSVPVCYVLVFYNIITKWDNVLLKVKLMFLCVLVAEEEEPMNMESMGKWK